MPEECQETLILDIKAFVSHTPIQKPIQSQKIEARYPERSKGNFSVTIEDEKLNTLVKSIQDIIKAMQ